MKSFANYGVFLILFILVCYVIPNLSRHQSQHEVTPTITSKMQGVEVTKGDIRNAKHTIQSINVFAYCVIFGLPLIAVSGGIFFIVRDRLARKASTIAIISLLSFAALSAKAKMVELPPGQILKMKTTASIGQLQESIIMAVHDEDLSYRGEKVLSAGLLKAISKDPEHKNWTLSIDGDSKVINGNILIVNGKTGLPENSQAGSAFWLNTEDSITLNTSETVTNSPLNKIFYIAGTLFSMIIIGIIYSSRPTFSQGEGIELDDDEFDSELGVEALEPENEDLKPTPSAKTADSAKPKSVDNYRNPIQDFYPNK